MINFATCICSNPVHFPYSHHLRAGAQTSSESFWLNFQQLMGCTIAMKLVGGCQPTGQLALMARRVDFVLHDLYELNELKGVASYRRLDFLAS